MIDAPNDGAALDGLPDELPANPRRRGRAGVRARTLAVKKVSREELRAGALAYPPVEGEERPLSRAECVDGERPCPWVSCKHHLYLDVNAETGTIKLNLPTLEPWEMVQSCSLDVADQGGATLEEVGALMNLTRERTRQIEVRALFALKMAGFGVEMFTPSVTQQTRRRPRETRERRLGGPVSVRELFRGNAGRWMTVSEVMSALGLSSPSSRDLVSRSLWAMKAAGELEALYQRARGNAPGKPPQAYRLLGEAR